VERWYVVNYEPTVTRLNDVVLPTVFVVVEDVAEQNCSQFWTMLAPQHYSISQELCIGNFVIMQSL
jgi:hypothetical protein